VRPQDFLTKDEFVRLKAACLGDREKAIVLTLAGTGIRVNELCNIKIEDIDFNHGYIHIEVAKGGRPRTVVAPSRHLIPYRHICIVKKLDSCSLAVRAATSALAK
jgi:integrase/recombinase XerD